MRIAGILLLLAGWMIVVSAVALFNPAAAVPRAIFIVAGLCIEGLGLVYVVLSNVPRAARGDNA